MGAGTGATVGKVHRIGRAMRGGIGSASAKLDDIVVGALVAVNAVGDVRDPDTGALIAGARDAPDGRRLIDSALALAATDAPERFAAPGNTTIGVVATNARLSKTEAAKLASLAMLGFARALSPPHTAFDGDTLFALSIGDRPADLTRLGLAAADAVAARDRPWRAGRDVARRTAGRPRHSCVVRGKVARCTFRISTRSS